MYVSIYGMCVLTVCVYVCMYVCNYVLMYVHVCNYRIALNYDQSRINAWSRLVAGEISNITKINAVSRINAGSFVG